MNCVVGLVHKYYGDELVRSLFDAWEGDIRQAMLDDFDLALPRERGLRAGTAPPSGAFGPPPRPCGLLFGIQYKLSRQE